MTSYLLIVVMGFYSGYNGWGGVDTQKFQSYESCELARHQIINAVRDSHAGRPRMGENNNELVTRCIPIKEVE